MLAEKDGFEPSNPFTGYTISSRAPSTKLGDFSIYETVDAAAGQRAGASADLKREAVGQRRILYHSIVRLSMEKSFLVLSLLLSYNTSVTKGIEKQRVK